MSEPSANLPRILWLTLLVAQAVYVAVGLTAPGLLGTSLADRAAFPLALGGVALASAAVAHVMWRRASGAGLAVHQAREADPQQTFTFLLLAWVVDESIALYGMLLALLGFALSTWLLFAAGAAALMLVHRPRQGA